MKPHGMVGYHPEQLIPHDHILRYSFKERLNHWIAAGSFVSGLVLWFTESIPWSLRWIRYISVVVHAGTALLMIGNFMIHVYMGVFAERGAFGSVIRGDVSLAFAKRYHPGWYKEIVGESDSSK